MAKFYHKQYTLQSTTYRSNWQQTACSEINGQMQNRIDLRWSSNLIVMVLCLEKDKLLDRCVKLSHRHSRRNIWQKNLTFWGICKSDRDWRKCECACCCCHRWLEEEDCHHLLHSPKPEWVAENGLNVFAIDFGNCTKECCLFILSMS